MKKITLRITNQQSQFSLRAELQLLGIVLAAKKTRMFTEGLSAEQFEIWTYLGPSGNHSSQLHHMIYKLVLLQ